MREQERKVQHSECFLYQISYTKYSTYWYWIMELARTKVPWQSLLCIFNKIFHENFLSLKRPLAPAGSFSEGEARSTKGRLLRVAEWGARGLAPSPDAWKVLKFFKKLNEKFTIWKFYRNLLFFQQFFKMWSNFSRKFGKIFENLRNMHL